MADPSLGPEARYEARETVELAFIAGLQRPPPRQRAALVLCDGLGGRTGQVAETLGTSTASVRAARQRARTTLRRRRSEDSDGQAPAPGSPRARACAQQFADAFASDDVDALVALLTDEAWLTMPPARLAYQGPVAIASFLRASATFRDGRHFRLVPTRANLQPAHALYLPHPPSPVAPRAGLVVIGLRGDRIDAITRFRDDRVCWRFGLPAALPAS